MCTVLEKLDPFKDPDPTVKDWIGLPNSWQILVYSYVKDAQRKVDIIMEENQKFTSQNTENRMVLSFITVGYLFRWSVGWGCDGCSAAGRDPPVPGYRDFGRCLHQAHQQEHHHPHQEVPGNQTWTKLFILEIHIKDLFFNLT